MKNLIILLLSVLLFASCSNNDTEKAGNLSKEELHTLAINIQKDFAKLNMKMDSISEDNLEDMNKKISFLADEIKQIRKELPNDEVSVEVLKTSHTLYSELLAIYNEAGFKTDEIEKKIDKLKKGIKNL